LTNELTNNLNEIKSYFNLLDKFQNAKPIGNGVYRVNPCPLCGSKSKDSGHFTIYAPGAGQSKENWWTYSSFNGCCKGGSIIDYYKEFRGMTQEEATKKVIDEYNNHTNNVQASKKITTAKPIVEPPDLTLLVEQYHKNLFEYTITDKDIIHPLEYLKSKRGLTEETIKLNKIGFCGGGYNEFIKDFPQFKIKEADTIYYKLLFPVLEADGTCKYIIFRHSPNVDQGNRPKYRNMKGLSTRIWNDKYLVEDPPADTIFICEGIINALSIEQLGYKSIATTSTNNLNKLLDIIKINIENLKNVKFIITFDNDENEAGQKATKKLTKEFNVIGLKFNVLNLDNGINDINDLLVSDINKLNELLKQTIEATPKVINIEPKGIEKISTNRKIIKLGTFENREECCYYCNYSDGTIKQISNFIIEPIEILTSTPEAEREKFVEMVCYIKMFNKKIKTILTLEAFIDIKIFKKQIGLLDAVCNITNGDLPSIQQIIIKNYDIPRVKALEYAGLHNIDGEWFFVTGNKVIDKYGNEVNSMRLSELKKTIDSNILNYDPITEEELKIILPLVFKYNRLEITTTILLYSIVCFMKYKINKLDDLVYKIPILNIVGEGGSGKSDTIGQIFNSIIGAKSSNTIKASGVTEFTLLKMLDSNSSIPVTIQEIKESNVALNQWKILSSTLQNNYDGYGSARGKQDQTINYYKNLAPIVLLGESGFIASAAQERLIKLYFSKINLDDEHIKVFYELLEHKNLLSKLGKTLLLGMMSQNAENLINILKTHESRKYLKDPRINRNLSFMLTALGFFKGILSRYGTDITLTGYTIDELKEAVKNTFYEFNIAENEKNKSTIDYIFEFFDFLIGEGALKDKYDFVVKDNMLKFQLKNIENKLPKYKEEYKKKGLEIPEDWTKQLKYISYYITNDAKERFIVDEYTKKTQAKQCYALDLNKMKHLDIQNLIPNITNKNINGKFINLDEVAQAMTNDEQLKIFGDIQ